MFRCDSVFSLYGCKEIAIQCVFVYLGMHNGGLQQMMNVSYPKRKLNPNLNESENPSDFGFAKNCRNPTTFGFRFVLLHIPGLLVEFFIFLVICSAI